MKKTNTVALVITESENSSKWVDTLSDEFEIQYLEEALNVGKANPMEEIYEMRAKQSKQDTEFGDYVEELLSRPFVQPSVQGHAVKWLKSKIRIEKYQKMEQDAAKIIAEYAYKVFQGDPGKVDFFLCSPKSKIRIRIFKISPPPLAS